jgi:hypothetical protein
VLPNEADEASDLAYILATVMVEKSRLKFFYLRTYFEAGKALFDLTQIPATKVAGKSELKLF